MKINTELCCKRYDFLTKKTQSYRYQNYCPVSSKFFATSGRVWTRSTSLSSFQRSNGSPTYILHVFHLEDTSLLFIFLSEFRTELHKMKINTELCCKSNDFLTKKTQNYCYQNYCPGWQLIFKSKHQHILRFIFKTITLLLVPPYSYNLFRTRFRMLPRVIHSV
jgi:hypothetical protein